MMATEREAVKGLDAEIALVTSLGEKLADNEKEEIPAIKELSQKIEQLNKDNQRVKQLVRDVESQEAERKVYRKLFDGLYDSQRKLKEIEASLEEEQVPLQYGESKQKRLFEKCMGLEFKLTDDKAICFVFKYVNNDDPEKTYSIALDMDKEGKWEVVNLEPVIHGVKPLLDALNDTNNLTQFCKHFRQKIKDSLQ